MRVSAQTCRSAGLYSQKRVTWELCTYVYVFCIHVCIYVYIYMHVVQAQRRAQLSTLHALLVVDGHDVGYR